MHIFFIYIDSTPFLIACKQLPIYIQQRRNSSHTVLMWKVVNVMTDFLKFVREMLLNEDPSGFVFLSFFETNCQKSGLNFLGVMSHP